MNSANTLKRSAIQDTTPSIDELVTRARALKPILREKARETELNRRVSAEVIDLMRQNGLFNAIKPKRFGGYEYGPSAIFRIGFELAQACGSSSWCAMIAICDTWFGSYWSLQAQEDIWKNPDNLIAGAAVPTGICQAVKGGYKIHGRWPFASNCENSQWVFISAMLPKVDGEQQGVGWFMVPMDELEVDQDTWHVSGLQGSGSKTIYCDNDIFVPEYRLIRFNDIALGKTPGNAIPHNIQAGFVFTTFAATSLIVNIMGMTQGALDFYVESMKSKVKVAMRPGAPMGAAHSPFAQEVTGRVSAMVEASRIYILNELTELEAKVQSGEILSNEERLRIRRCFAFAADQCVQAIGLLYANAGAASSSLDNPIQRYWRDINMAAQHVSLDVKGIYSCVGQNLYGLPIMGGY
jgi:3-hydroxy-9,10-secoandrosta-1,3,5(10)-triene-9,17-dione monooxygenase